MSYFQSGYQLFYSNRLLIIAISLLVCACGPSVTDEVAPNSSTLPGAGDSKSDNITQGPDSGIEHLYDEPLNTLDDEALTIICKDYVQLIKDLNTSEYNHITMQGECKAYGVDRVIMDLEDGELATDASIEEMAEVCDYELDQCYLSGIGFTEPGYEINIRFMNEPSCKLVLKDQHGFNPCTASRNDIFNCLQDKFALAETHWGAYENRTCEELVHEDVRASVIEDLNFFKTDASRPQSCEIVEEQCRYFYTNSY